MLGTLKAIYTPKRNRKRQTAMVLKNRKKHIQYAYGESLSVFYAFVLTWASDFILMNNFHGVLKGMGNQQVGMK